MAKGAFELTEFQDLVDQVAADPRAKGAKGDPGSIPNHETDGTRIRFQKSDGSWGAWITLGTVPDPDPIPDPPPVITLSITPDSLPAGGGEATVAWNVANATKVTATDGSTTQDVEAQGSMQETFGQTTTVELTAVGPGGTSKQSATVTVAATIPDPEPDPDDPPPQTGDLVSGKPFTLKGNFGSKSNPQPLFFDTVERVFAGAQSSTPYSSVSNGSAVPTGSSWPWNDQENNILKLGPGTYGERSREYRATITANHWGKYQSAWVQKPSAWPSSGPNRAYIRWLLKLSFDPTSQTGSHKFIRIWDSKSSNSDWKVSWTQMHLTYPGGGPSWATTKPIPNQWNLFELFIDKSQRRLIASLNGKVIHNVSNLSNSGGGIQPRLVGFDASGAADFRNGSVQFTDYYADSTAQRVELSNAPDLASSSRREPQVVTSWNGDITFTANLGAHTASGPLWALVIGADGNVTDVVSVR
jgi:hypothetical protein